MCGDFDDNERIDEELFDKFIEIAGRYGVQPSDSGSSPPPSLDNEEERAAYTRQLFAAGLGRSLSDAASLPPGERMDAVAGQAIVFARLAGFLAGQFPPGADLYRTINAAMLDGHREPNTSC